MASKPKKKSWFSRWLERLAEINEREFGGQVPDCCAGKHLPPGQASFPARQPVEKSTHTGK
ncbi:MAG TPA: hypothetical protein GXX30_07715 [Firmicutes bacterium]|nr:hypothetical protein [Candidatus Fermentithermobacillaceae bacterium]